jgi:hypothetical protein
VKPGIRNVLLSVVVLMLGFVAYSKRFQISAIVWHWENGDFVRVGSYEVPVPRNWLVKAQPLGGSLLVDTQFRRGSSVLSGINVISADSLSVPTNDLDFWKSNKEKWLKNNGVRNPEERSLSFEDEAVACLGGHELHEVMQLPDAADVVSVDCRSSGKLHLMFVGQQPNLELFYSLIPEIRKHK